MLSKTVFFYEGKRHKKARLRAGRLLCIWYLFYVCVSWLMWLFTTTNILKFIVITVLEQDLQDYPDKAGFVL